jgi:glycosyltransferase involved in cell wall biosynthesis
MKVLLVAGTVFPEQLSIWRACRRAGVDLRLIGSNVRTRATALPSTPRMPVDIPSVLIPPVRLLPNKGPLWWLYPELPGVLKRLEPDLIHVLCEPWGMLALQSLVVARTRDRSIPMCAHGADNVFVHGPRLEQAVRRYVLAEALPRLGGFVGWTDAVVELAHKFGLPRSTPTAVVPGEAADPQRFLPASRQDRLAARRKWGLTGTDRVVGFIGRLAEEKGILDALAAVGMLDKGSTLLCVWGSGPLESQLGSVAAELGGALRLMGPLELHEVPLAFHASDVVVMPSKVSPWWSEQFGRVALEAMLSGSAIVAYRSGALPQVLRDAAVFVDEGDVRGLAMAVSLLLDDESRRSELGRKARAVALRRFHPDVLAGQMIEFWSRVTAQAPPLWQTP